MTEESEASDIRPAAHIEFHRQLTCSPVEA
jgi:hypothetical protein